MNSNCQSLAEKSVSQPVCIVGLGLIGGSLLRRLTAAGYPAFGWNRSASTVQQAAADGMDTRHMRAIRQAAEHEAGLIEQALIPHARHPEQASKIAAETTKVMMHAHTAMVYDMLEHWSGN